MGADASKQSDSSANSVPSEPDKQKEINKMDHAVRNRVRNQSNQQYTMKIVIRGERGTGKTSLWRRLQGLPFGREYFITPEIQISTINWSFKNNEETVKVDVWDIVDEGFIAGTPVDTRAKDLKPAELGGKLTSMISKVNAGKHQIAALDASTCDVYKGVRMVVFMVNPYYESSLQYVQEKYEDVPTDVSILILLNFLDTLKVYINRSFSSIS